MLNGVGLMLASLKYRNSMKLIWLPISLITTGMVLFPGMIFYSNIYEDRRFIKLVMDGGSCTTAGWFFLAFA